MSRRSGNQDISSKSEKMQRYYAERETTGPEFGEFPSVRYIVYGTQWTQNQCNRGSQNQPPKRRMCLLC